MFVEDKSKSNECDLLDIEQRIINQKQKESKERDNNPIDKVARITDVILEEEETDTSDDDEPIIATNSAKMKSRKQLVRCGYKITTIL